MERLPCRYCGETPPEHIPLCDNSGRQYPLLGQPVIIPAVVLAEVRADREVRQLRRRRSWRRSSAAYRQRLGLARRRPTPDQVAFVRQLLSYKRTGAA